MGSSRAEGVAGIGMHEVSVDIESWGGRGQARAGVAELVDAFEFVVPLARGGIAEGARTEVGELAVTRGTRPVVALAEAGVGELAECGTGQQGRFRCHDAPQLLVHALMVEADLVVVQRLRVIRPALAAEVRR
jgi:hypothetical protein